MAKLRWKPMRNQMRNQVIHFARPCACVDLQGGHRANAAGLFHQSIGGRLR